MNDFQTTNEAIYADMREIIFNARSSAVRGVEYARMMMYWRLGERIFVEDL